MDLREILSSKLKNVVKASLKRTEELERISPNPSDLFRSSLKDRRNAIWRNEPVTVATFSDDS